jgi:hypothetical protein
MKSKVLCQEFSAFSNKHIEEDIHIFDEDDKEGLKGLLNRLAVGETSLKDGTQDGDQKEESKEPINGLNESQDLDKSEGGIHAAPKEDGAEFT